jgi:hypothetical protein
MQTREIEVIEMGGKKYPPLKIYFSGSIAGGMDDAPVYQKIIQELEYWGEVFTKHLWDPDLHAALRAGRVPAGFEYLATSRGTYRQDCRWIKKAEILIAEVSCPSHGVGYEVGFAEANQIPVMLLYREGSPKKISDMFAGNDYNLVLTYKDLSDLRPQLQKAMAARLKGYRRVQL